MKNRLIKNVDIFLLLSIPLLFWGCSKKAVIKEGASTITPTPPSAETPKQEEDLETSIRGKDFSTITSLPAIYFDFDSPDVRSDMREVLAKNAEYLKNKPSLEIRVDGHCDERGTTEYNVALGQRRAASIRAYYKSLGIAGNRIGTISWGEEKPACEESDESCWGKNRRAETKVRLKEEKKDASKPATKAGSQATTLKPSKAVSDSSGKP